MMLRKTLLLALTLGVLAAVPAMAEEHTAPMGDHKGPGMEMKNPADTDGDGFLSRAEFDAAQNKRFTEMDTNSDGKISKEEHKAFRESKKSEWKERRDEWKAKHDDKKPGDGPSNTGE